MDTSPAIRYNIENETVRIETKIANELLEPYRRYYEQGRGSWRMPNSWAFGTLEGTWVSRGRFRRNQLVQTFVN